MYIVYSNKNHDDDDIYDCNLLEINIEKEIKRRYILIVFKWNFNDIQ